ncbi:MAG: hypothetical protein LUD50_07575, partial [Clostridia bacterium]|nr:hypothetical protein [Clostridia bacterium]
VLDHLSPEQAAKVVGLVRATERTFSGIDGSRFDISQDYFGDTGIGRPSPANTVSEQIRRGEEKLAELRRQRNARESEIMAGAASELGHGIGAGAGMEAVRNSLVPNDERIRAYDAAIKQMEDAVKELRMQRRRDTGSKGKFWAAAGNAVADPSAWDFGTSNVRNAMTTLDMDRLKDGTPEGERAYDALAAAIMTNQDVQDMFAGNANFWERAGNTTGAMVPFMADFLMFSLVGGEGVNVVGGLAEKAAGRMATGTAGKVAGWTVKALGTTADDFIKGAVMANTIQLADTEADIINRKLGNLQRNADGSYSFENDKTWGQAAWQAEGNQIVENASEMFGTHLPASSEVVGKIAKVFGAKRLGKVLASADAKGIGAAIGTANKWLETLGISGTFGEVSEEYVGQLEKTILGIEDAYQYNPDGSRTNLFLTKQFHGDIWGGMFLSMGLMNAPRLGMTGAAYSSMKHDVNRADAKCGVMFGDDWSDMRDRIDRADNSQIGTLIDEIDENAALNDDQKLAVMDYVVRSLMFRGYNLACVAAGRTGEQTPQEREARAVEGRQTESWLDGYNASPEEFNRIKSAYELQGQKLAETLGAGYADADDEQFSKWIEQSIDLARSARTDAERDLYMDRANTFADYLNARQAYEGMMQGVRDELDLKVLQSDQLVDSQRNQWTGQIQTATTRTGEAVHVVNGNLTLREDGTIDAQNSSESVVIRHDGGKLEMVSPDYLATADAPVDAQTVKEQAAERIRQQYAQEAADGIDGTVTAFNPGDTYTLTDQNGNQIQITLADNGTGTADNGDGTVMATDQNGSPMRLTREMIQGAADQANAARARQAEDERQRQIQEQESPQEQTQTEQPAPETQRQEAPQRPQSALDQIPKDEQGNPDFERAPSPDVAYDAITEMAGGDTDTAQTVIEQTVAEKERDLDKAKKAKSAGGATIAEKIASETGRKSAIDAAQRSLDFWKGLAEMRRRRAEAEAARAAEEENRRKAAEEAAARKAQEETEKAAEEAAEAQRKAIEEERQRQQEESESEEKPGKTVQPTKEGLFRTYGKGKRRFDSVSGTVVNDVKKVGRRLIKDLDLPEGIGIDNCVKYYGDGKEYVMLFLPTGDGDEIGIEFDFHREDDYGNEFEGFRQTSGAIYIKNKKRTRGISEPVRLGGDLTYEDLLSAVKEELEKYRKVPFGPSTFSLTEDPDDRRPTLGRQVERAGEETDPNPTPAQAEAGNYKKGHVTIGNFDISIENPAGSVRRGVDGNGKEWSTEMRNTYGYILGHYDTDGDHIDVFLGNDLDYWDGHRVFVVDQYNPDGSFDEHKVMIGFNDAADAMRAYLDNYEKGWEKGRRLEISSIPASDFEKWVESSGRKTKPFAEYVNAGIENTQGAEEAEKEPKPAPKSGGMHEVDVMGLMSDLNKNGSAKFSDHYVGEERPKETPKEEPYSAVLSRPYKVDPAERNDFKKFGGIYDSVKKDIKALAGHLIDDLGVRDLQSEFGENSGIDVRKNGIAASIGDIVVRKKGKEYDEVGVSMHFGNDESGNVGLGYAAVSVVHHDSPTGSSDMTVWYTVDLKDGMTYG